MRKPNFKRDEANNLGKPLGKRLTRSILIVSALTLVTVAGGPWRSRAATNRFAAVGGSDTSNDCTLQSNPCATIQHAINQSSSGDQIILGPGTYTENVTVSQNVAIRGDATKGSTVNGNNAASVFTINPGVTATFSGLTITNGNAPNSPFDLNKGGGGGISNSFTGILTVVGCTVSGNRAPNGTGAGGGGGIFNVGTLTVIKSTISNNSAGSFGGGILNLFGGSALTVVDSTISNNSAGTYGGGIFNKGTGSIVNSTISGNSGGSQGGGIVNSEFTMSVVNSTISANDPGGILNDLSTTLSLRNNIISGNLGFQGDCSNLGTISTNSHNLIQDGSCGPAISGDPKLGPLQNNGGPTFTQALLPGSPAIDAGDDSVLSPPFNLTTDQRGPGFPRKSGLHVDIGAFEAPPFDACLKDNTTGNLLQWNSTTGQYKFTGCSDGFMLTGTGVVKLVNGIRTLTDFKTDRRISAAFNTGQLTGNATLYLMVAQGVWQSFRIVATNPSAVCACPG